MITSEPTTIVVGTGYIGRRVLESFDAGDVIGLSRSPLTTSRPLLLFDLDAGANLPLPLPDRYRVLYTVAPATDSEQDVRLERFLAGLESPPMAFVYISTTGIYGDRGGGAVDEQAAPSPATARARRRVAAEQMLQQWSATHAVRLCILRAPGIYGPGRLGLGRIRDGLPLLREADAAPGNRIHADDLATCCIVALTNTAATGVFNVADGDERSSTWFANEVAQQAGLQAPPQISREEAQTVFSARRLSFLNESRRVDTRRMREILRVTPQYANAEDGIRASLTEESSVDGLSENQG